MTNLIKALIIFFTILISTNAYAQNYYGKKKEIDKILKNVENFSQYYMNGEYRKLAECYTQDGKIFPGNEDIIEGIEDIENKWILPNDVKTTKHKVTPSEIRIVKNYAYDYGYYEGETLLADGKTSAWKGKYVIVWRKVGKNWKIYLDIWNPIKE